MKVQGRKDITRVMREDRQAVDEALTRGVRDAMLRHKKDDLPVVIERDGKIEWVKPEDLGF
ncbi:MAG: hypothetical protein HYY76_02160 [Acidobacteria bacterium]|nr:hypothetical protein [Acidobacteriota bacterium]